MVGTNYTLNNGETITVPTMLGSSTKIKELSDGTYAVETKGSIYGSTPETTVYTADELVEKYNTELERTPEDDTFLKSTDTMSEENNVSIDYNLFQPSTINGTLDGIDYSLSENKRAFSETVDYSGNINGKEAQYEVTPYKGLWGDGSIKGQIGEDEVNLTIKKGMFGKTQITGTYKGQEINLTIQSDWLGNKTITGNDTNVKIDNQFLSSDKSVSGEFGSNSELMPLLLSYMKVDQDKQNRDAAIYM